MITKFSRLADEMFFNDLACKAIKHVATALLMLSGQENLTTQHPPKLNVYFNVQNFLSPGSPLNLFCHVISILNLTLKRANLHELLSLKRHRICTHQHKIVFLLLTDQKARRHENLLLCSHARFKSCSSLFREIPDESGYNLKINKK